MRMVVRKTAIALAFMLGSSGIAAAGPALLFDAANGTVLYAEDQDQQWHPASLTKIMTAYLVFEALKSNALALDQKIPVSANANVLPPSKLGLPVGAEISVNLALRALIVKSANDAAMMLAEAIAGSEEGFVRRMNETALRLGMTQTRFVNPHGLPAPEQVTTARDLARLTRAVLADYPDYDELWASSDMQIGRRRLRTHNGLLRTYEGADGLKTGFICDSGYNVVATATRDNRRLAAVVLGEYTSRDRSLRAASLLEHGFRTYDWKALFGGSTLETEPISAESAGPRSVREFVAAFGCNNRRQARSVPTKRSKKARVVKKNGEAAAKSADVSDAPTSAAKSP